MYAPCMAFTKSCGEVFEFLERHKRFSDVSHADGIVAATYIGGDSVVAVPLSKCGEDVHIEPPPRKRVVGPLPEGVELPDTDYDPGRERRAAVAHLEETYETARRELGDDHAAVVARPRRRSRRRARRARSSSRAVRALVRGELGCQNGGHDGIWAPVSATVLRSDAAGRPRLARGSRSVRAMRMAWIV